MALTVDPSRDEIDDLRQAGARECLPVAEFSPETWTRTLEFCHRETAISRELASVTARLDWLVHMDSLTGLLNRKGIERAILDGGESLPADVVILAIGVVPNSELAKTAGVELGRRTAAVMVDQAMRTSVPDIFACGDCAKKTSFFGGIPSYLRLASIATSEARIAGSNLFGIRRENIGTVGVWSTAVGNLAMGTAGLTESMAQAQGYRVISTTVEGPNRHPGIMPGAVPTRVKLVFERHSGVILGGQVAGDTSAGEIINALSACIQSRMTADQMATFQIGTHPALTASPIAYPVVNAAELAISKMQAE